MDNNTKQNIYLVCKESEGIPDIDAIKQDELRVFNTHEAADEFAKFQRNTYVCNPNFADFTYMPDESKEGENYAFAYNLAPDGMSREGGFNIIIAEVPMKKDEDAHNNCVTSLKELGKVAIFNADEVLSFTLDKGEEYQLDEANGMRTGITKRKSSNFLSFIRMIPRTMAISNFMFRCRQNKRKRFLCVWKSSSKKPTVKALRMPLKSC